MNDGWDRPILQAVNNDNNNFNVNGENLRWNFNDSNHSQQTPEENGYRRLISDDIGNLIRDSGNTVYSGQQYNSEYNGSHQLREKMIVGWRNQLLMLAGTS